MFRFLKGFAIDLITIVVIFLYYTTWAFKIVYFYWWFVSMLVLLALLMFNASDEVKDSFLESLSKIPHWFHWYTYMIRWIIGFIFVAFGHWVLAILVLLNTCMIHEIWKDSR